jgi:predicted dithiol-disulfide oxidoreductase (DUF899 family)
VPAIPPIVDHRTWLDQRTSLLAREKAHTREGDAIAAARRRLPMTEIENVELVGADGPVRLLDLFQGRQQLVVYLHMFHSGQPIEQQCEGCTLTQWNFQEASYLNEEGVSYAVICEGPWAEVGPFREFMGYPQPWYSADGVDVPPFNGGYGTIVCFLRVGDRIYETYETTDRGVEPMMTTLKLLDLTVYGRQESWEDSPEDWPQRAAYSFWRRDGRPTGQWTRPGAGPVAHGEAHCR